MIRSLWTARTGLDAQQTSLDVISNNLANVSTNGFKRANEVFHGSPAYTSKALAEADALGRWWFLEVAYEGRGEPIPFEYLSAREDSSDAERPSR